MLKRLSFRERMAVLLEEYAGRIRTSFSEAVDLIRSRIVLQRVVTRMEKNDIAGAMDAMEIDRGDFNSVLDEIAAAFNAGGVASVDNLPILRDPAGHRVVIRFDYRNPTAEAWLKDHSSQLVTRILEDQRQAIRVALSEGLAVGANPRQTALGIIGRVNRVTGRREGGIIGLTSAQERYVASARAELLSGDAAQLRSYLTRTRRDRRFDGAVNRAIRDGKPVPTDVVSRITGRYSDRLLQLRGEMLARTETMTALNVAQDQAMRQAIADGKVDAQVVTKVWHSAGDNRVRHTHQILSGQSVGIDGVFQSPSGALVRFPGDPNAPAEEIIGCRCWLEHQIDFLAGVT